MRDNASIPALPGAAIKASYVTVRDYASLVNAHGTIAVNPHRYVTNPLSPALTDAPWEAADPAWSAEMNTCAFPENVLKSTLVQTTPKYVISKHSPASTNVSMIHHALLGCCVM